MINYYQKAINSSSKSRKESIRSKCSNQVSLALIVQEKDTFNCQAGWLFYVFNGFINTWKERIQNCLVLICRLTQIHPSRSWEMVFGDWDVKLEKRRNLHS